jgi:hypothetical protein
MRGVWLTTSVAVTLAAAALAAPAGAGPYSNVAAAMVRGAAPSIEAYYADHGTYVGATLAKLRAYDRNLSSIEIAYTHKDTYCLQANVLGSWYHVARTGPAANAFAGGATRCPRS